MEKESQIHHLALTHHAGAGAGVSAKATPAANIATSQDEHTTTNADTMTSSPGHGSNHHVKKAISNGNSQNLELKKHSTARGPVLMCS